MSVPDEFETIARLFRPLAEAAPEALDLTDDAAIIPSRPGYDLVITKDAMAAGVHFLPDDRLDLVARKLLRVNLSDLAAKGAEPYGYFLSVAWPGEADWTSREAFAAGLATDQAAFGLKLFGGDTISTPGPLLVSATMLGWVRAGAMVRRSTARAGDLLQVSGPIGDGWLGLAAARGLLPTLDEHHLHYLVERYKLPVPRLDVDLGLASASADVSDGLIADAAHIAEASGLGLRIELDQVPLSNAAQAWLEGQPDAVAAVASLAAGGDDYQIVAAGPRPIPGFVSVGQFVAKLGLEVSFAGRSVAPARSGWRHGNND